MSSFSWNPVSYNSAHASFLCCQNIFLGCHPEMNNGGEKPFRRRAYFHSLPYLGDITTFRLRHERHLDTLRCGGGWREKFLRADYRCQTSCVPLFRYWG